MHDFCFTIPYGLLLVCGGVIGYAKKGSVASLAGDCGTGLFLILVGYLSLKAFHKRKNSYLALILETIIAAVLTWGMGQRYMQTSKMMPAGIVAGLRKKNHHWEITNGCDLVSVDLWRTLKYKMHFSILLEQTGSIDD